MVKFMRRGFWKNVYFFLSLGSQKNWGRKMRFVLEVLREVGVIGGIRECVFRVFLRCQLQLLYYFFFYLFGEFEYFFEVLMYLFGRRSWKQKFKQYFLIWLRGLKQGLVRVFWEERGVVLQWRYFYSGRFQVINIDLVQV